MHALFVTNNIINLDLDVHVCSVMFAMLGVHVCSVMFAMLGVHVCSVMFAMFGVHVCSVMFAMFGALSHRVGTLRTAIIIIFIQCNTVTCMV